MIEGWGIDHALELAASGLAATINAHKKAYYLELHRASEINHIDAWLGWFGNVVLEAQSRTLQNIRFLTEKARFLDRLRDKLNAR